MKPMKQFAVMHPAALAVAHETVKNQPLTQMIEQAANPYHALHVAKAFQLKTAHPKAITQVQPVTNNPWLMMKGKTR